MKDEQFTLWPPNANPRFIVQGFSLFEIRPGRRRWDRSCFNRNAWCQSRNSIGSGASGTNCTSGTAHYANTFSWTFIMHLVYRKSQTIETKKCALQSKIHRKQKFHIQTNHDLNETGRRLVFWRVIVMSAQCACLYKALIVDPWGQNNQIR